MGFPGAVGPGRSVADDPTRKRVLLAEPRGYCAGVDRAVETVERALESYGAPVYVRHEIVHNRHVVDTLVKAGAVFVEETDEVPEGAIVVFSAHGVAPTVLKSASPRETAAASVTGSEGVVTISSMYGWIDVVSTSRPSPAMRFTMVNSVRSLIAVNCPSQWNGAVAVFELARWGVRLRLSGMFGVWMNQTRPSSLPPGWQLAHATTPAGVTWGLVASKKSLRPDSASAE